MVGRRVKDEEKIKKVEEKEEEDESIKIQSKLRITEIIRIIEK